MGNLIAGKNLDFYIVINGYNYAVAHATECTIKFAADIQETTTANGLKGKTYEYTGKYGWTLSVKGISNLIDTANFSTFQLAILQQGKLNFIFTDNENVSFTGTVLVNGSQMDSVFSAISNFSADMTGDGEIVPIYENVPPTPAGASVTIIDQLGNLIATILAPGTYGVLRFDTIDCGHADTVSPLIIISA